MSFNAFLLGVIATSALASGLFFLKFWRRTRDILFLAFAVAFIIEGLSRAARLSLAVPNEANPWVYGVRLATFLFILAAIINKNRGA